MNNKKYIILRILALTIFFAGWANGSASAQNCTADFSFTVDPSNTLSVTFQSLSTPVDSIFSYNWDFGDGNSDSSGQQIVIAHLYDTTDVYEVCLTIMATDTAGMICDSTFCSFVEVCANPVWPGDANNDGVANNFDILPLGLMFGQTGIPSSDTSTVWDPRCVGEWNDTIIGSITNLKYADGNGDGQIDAADTFAINRNYGSTHNKQSTSPCADPADPPLFFVFSQTIVEAGTAVDVDIHLGTQSNPINAAYGVVFTVDYDPNLVDSGSMAINYDQSIFQDSSGMSITIQNDQFDLGKIDGGIVRTNFQSVSGFGPIGRLSFVMEDDLVQRPEDLTDSLIELPFILEFSDVLIIDSNNNAVGFCSRSDSITVYQVLTGLEDQPTDGRMTIVPNPFSERLKISRLGEGQKHLSLYDLRGNQMKSVFLSSKQQACEMDVSELPAGLYLIKVTTEYGKWMKKLIKR